MTNEEEIIRLMRRTPYEEMVKFYSQGNMSSWHNFCNWIRLNNWTLEEFAQMHLDNT